VPYRRRGRTRRGEETCWGRQTGLRKTGRRERPCPPRRTGCTINGAVNPLFDYDANGSMTDMKVSGGSHVWDISWTTFNMVSSIVSGTARADFAYGTEHQKIRMQTFVTPSTLVDTTVFLDDPISGVHMEVYTPNGGATKWQHFLFAYGRPVGVRTYIASPATFSYFVTDHLGSVSIVTDAAGGVLERLSYDAWGRRRCAAPSGPSSGYGSDYSCAGPSASQTDMGFTAHDMLDLLGMIDMRARVYSPILGRFLSADTVVPGVFNSQSMNRYSYVRNNPLSRVDPSGHMDEKTVAEKKLVVWIDPNSSNYRGDDRYDRDFGPGSGSIESHPSQQGWGDLATETQYRAEGLAHEEHSIVGNLVRLGLVGMSKGGSSSTVVILVNGVFLTIRTTTSGEVQMAQTFDPSIGIVPDWSSVILFSFSDAPARSLTLGDAVFLGSDMQGFSDFSIAPLEKQAIFIHEMVHVWQYTNWGAAAYYYLAAMAHASDTYDYDIHDMGNLNMEQQAMVFQNNFVDTYRFANGLPMSPFATLNRYYVEGFGVTTYVEGFALDGLDH
jgi:RHS repeat-associated protein